MAEYVAGHDREAIAAAQKAPPSGEMLMYIAMAYARLGESDKAAEAARRLRAEFPEFSVETYMRTSPVSAPEAVAAFRDGAGKAGLLGDGAAAKS